MLRMARVSLTHGPAALAMAATTALNAAAAAEAERVRREALALAPHDRGPLTTSWGVSAEERADYLAGLPGRLDALYGPDPVERGTRRAASGGPWRRRGRG